MEFSDFSCIRFYETYDEALRNGALDSLFLNHFKSVLISSGEQTKGKNLSSIIFNHIKQPQTYGIENIQPSSGQEKHFFEFIEKECPLIAANKGLSNKLKDISAAHAELLEKAFSEKEKKDYTFFYISLLKLRFLVDLAWMVKEHDLDRNHVLRYFGDYGDFESRESIQENNDWIENHEEKFKKFLENNQGQEILEWYKGLLKSIIFEKLSVKEQSSFFIESFLVFALGNPRGAWQPLKTIFYLGRFYNIHLLPIEWILDFKVHKVQKDQSLRIPEKMATLAKKRYKSIQDEKNGVCLFAQEQINRAQSASIKGRKSIQIGSKKLPILEIQNPDSRAIDNLPSGSDFASATKAVISSLFGTFIKGVKPNTDEFLSSVARILKTGLEKNGTHVSPESLESAKKHLPEFIQTPVLLFLTSPISLLPLCTAGDLQQWLSSSPKEMQEKALSSIIDSLKNLTTIQKYH